VNEMTLKKKYSKLQLPPHKTKIVFSDLDGTLLDSSTYSYTQAQEGLNVLNNNHVPLYISFEFNIELKEEENIFLLPFLCSNPFPCIPNLSIGIKPSFFTDRQ
jgi:hypothetical protein